MALLNQYEIEVKALTEALKNLRVIISTLEAKEAEKEPTQQMDRRGVINNLHLLTDNDLVSELMKRGFKGTLTYSKEINL